MPNSPCWKFFSHLSISLWPVMPPPSSVPVQILMSPHRGCIIIAGFVAAVTAPPQCYRVGLRVAWHGFRDATRESRACPSSCIIHDRTAATCDRLWSTWGRAQARRGRHAGREPGRVYSLLGRYRDFVPRARRETVCHHSGVNKKSQLVERWGRLEHQKRQTESSRTASSSASTSEGPPPRAATKASSERASVPASSSKSPPPRATRHAS